MDCGYRHDKHKSGALHIGSAKWIINFAFIKILLVKKVLRYCPKITKFKEKYLCRSLVFITSDISLRDRPILN